METLLQNFRFMFDNISCGVFFHDADGEFLDVNPTALELLGLDLEQFLGRAPFPPQWRIIHEDGTPLTPEQYPSVAVLRSGKPVTGFVAGVHNPVRQGYVWLNISATPMFRPGETRPYRAFVSLFDITTERQSMAELRQSEERFRSLMELSPDIISIIGSDGSLLYNSPAAFQIHGYTQEEMTGRNTLELIHPDDLAEVERSFRKVLASEDEQITVRYRYRNKDGSYQQMECRAVNHLANPLIGGIIALSRALSPLELQLQEKEAQYRAFAENSFDVIFILDSKGTFRFVSPSWELHFGYSRDEVLGKQFMPVVHPDDVQPCLDFLTRVMTSGQPGTSPRYRVKCADGSWKSFIANGSRFVNVNGEPLFHGIGRDLSLQEQMLETLRASEEKFAKAFNYSPALMAISTIDEGRYLEVNETFCSVSGLQRHEIVGRTSTEMGWLTTAIRQRMMEMLQRDGLIKDMEIELPRPDGSIFYCLFSAVPVTIGSDQRLLSIALDVSERNEMQLSLLRSEERYRAIVNSQTDFVDRFLPDGTLTFVNEALCRYVGLSADDLLGSSFFPFVHGDDLEALKDNLQALSPEKPTIETTDRIVLPDDRIRWHRWTSTAIFDNRGVLLEYQSVGRDITEEKVTREALAYANKCFVQALNASHHILYRLNARDGGYDYLGPAFEKVTGYRVEEFSQIGLEQLKDYFHPDDRLAVFTAIEDAVAGKASTTIPFEFEYRLRRADGSYCWLYDCTNASLNEEGVPESFFGSAYDITERKQIEFALKESEERYRRLIATANEGICIADGNYLLTYVNERFATMLGYAPAELLGMPVLRLIAAEEHAGFAENVAARQRGENTQRECWHRRKDGTLAWLLTSTAPIFDDDGSFQGCFAMFTDLTSRREAEVELKHAYEVMEQKVAERTASLAEANAKIKKMSYEIVRAEEQERRRIAAELHDQVGQSLLLAKMKLDMLASELRTEEKRANAEQVADLLAASIHDIRTLTFGMRPPMLDTAGLEAALRWLCVAIGNDYRLWVGFDWDCQSKLPDIEMNYTLYQAIRELLLNVVKHASVGRAGLAVSEAEGSIIVNIADRGRGFDYDAVAGNLVPGAGFGLFNVRQRIEQLGGSFAIKSSCGSGTVATITIPLSGKS